MNKVIYMYIQVKSLVLSHAASIWDCLCFRSGSTEVNISRLQHRVLDLLHYWLEGYYSIDFNGRQQLVNNIKEFVKDYVSEHFNKLLQIGSNIRHLVIFFINKLRNMLIRASLFFDKLEGILFFCITWYKIK